ncbi:MAG: protein translocase subunit SecF [Treponema sp.]|nr:protein translocase subunit SecF [Treponema sp.]
MRKTIQFSKAFLPCAILSLVLIAGGIVSVVLQGINFSIDFKPGYIEEVQISSNPSIEEVRDVLSEYGAAVKHTGSGEAKAYQVRIADNNQGTTVLDNVTKALSEKYGEITVLKTDFIGSQLSKTLGFQSILLLLGTMLCIWAYSAIRFRWDFALGAIIALLHDTLIMFTFFSVFQIEFGTLSIAAVLTIIGYSINDTVVILDRIRQNIQVVEVKTFNEVINRSLSDTLSRSIITTVTTLFAAVSLYVFTSGGIKDFALAIIVGLISGCYSSIAISSGFISLVRRNWKPSYGLHATGKSFAKTVSVN